MARHVLRIRHRTLSRVSLLSSHARFAACLPHTATITGSVTSATTDDETNNHDALPNVSLNYDLLECIVVVVFCRFRSHVASFFFKALGPN